MVGFGAIDGADHEFGGDRLDDAVDVGENDDRRAGLRRAGHHVRGVHQAGGEQQDRGLDAPEQADAHGS